MNRNAWSHALGEVPFVLLDGGLATQLEATGHDLDDPLWSAQVLLDHPEAVREVHRAYFAAGADLATTATYQASLEGLLAAGCDAAGVRRVWIEAVELAREAAAEFAERSPAPLVVGSLGSYGAALADGSEYRGHYRVGADALRRWHAPRFETLAEHADLVAFETVPCADEVTAIVRLLEGTPNVGAWVSLQCADASHTAAGEPLDPVLAALDACSGVVAVAFNCMHPDLALPLLRTCEGAGLTTPRIVYPNAGYAWSSERGWHGDGLQPDAFARVARSWWSAGARGGARGIGGCCRTGPEHIAAVAGLRTSLTVPRPR